MSNRLITFVQSLQNVSWSNGLPAMLLPEGAINETSVTIARQLQRAKTIEDVYKIDFPCTIANLHDQSFFAAFAQQPVEKVSGHLKQNGRPTSVFGLNHKYFEQLPEIMTVLTQHHDQISKNRRTSLSMWKSSHYAGTAMHFDFPEASPRDISMLAVNVSPSQGVPHADTLRILADSPFSHILKISLDAPNLGGILKKFYTQLARPETYAEKRLAENLSAAAMDLPVSAVNMLAGLTIHKRPPEDWAARVCLKAVTHFINSAPHF